ncbi:Clavaminate synthase-like protein [Aureobasidium pullulans]|uniref:Clavaminate synthase-like protein n=1 Tax=Aureobasidium pullulans TaxID=5580 RepID=A0A4S9RKI8_AURPU|nr:Clavaminate synthase-like protein [Aureobasidium pullulans]THY65561.1 Clavaminate synthase-like protein [Aureobasidium pullulans]THY98553.1 Clavaminate synthase-like protein [Aureobasidium pullulans]THZ77062.1 Clavaminate synthase-like protein [Aureobasidium pullulans]
MSVHRSAEQLEADLNFHDLPPFPEDVATAPLLRVRLSKLMNGDGEETNKLWEACCRLGFFYLDLRDVPSIEVGNFETTEKKRQTKNDNTKHNRVDSAGSNNDYDVQSKAGRTMEFNVNVDGEQLLNDAEDLFKVGQGVFDLPIEEKVKYDLKDQGSYFGYKGYGEGVIDAQGTKDRNEFYNVSKDDILEISDPLPAPEILSPHRELLGSFIQNSHALVNLLLDLLNSRLGLPHDKLPSLHRLDSKSGDQVRWVHAPPQPMDDQRTALGQHTDFGSVTILFNRLGGLQVLPPNSDEWSYVKPLRGHAVINLGDAMVKFTAGVLRSNTHRVVNPPGDQAGYTRMSLVYFARPADDVILKVLNGSALIDEQRRHNPDNSDEEITSKEWILRRALGRRQGGDWNKSGGTENGRVGR